MCGMCAVAGGEVRDPAGVGARVGGGAHRGAAYDPRVEQLQGRVAVVTGGASGIGLAMAERFAAAGMNLVLADVERPALERAAARFDPARVLAVPTDVTDADAVTALATATLDRFGVVHIVCANAGVGSRGLPIAELPVADFRWILGVNLFGVVHTVSAFLPLLRAQDDGHLVLTASVAALVHPPRMGPYNASKAAVLALGETLHHELAEEGSRVGVTVLCPGWVRTNLGSAERNRPEALAWTMNSDQAQLVAERRAFIAEVFARGGIAPEQVAEQVFEAVVARRFYVLTHPSMTPEYADRAARIVDGRDPAPPAL